MLTFKLLDFKVRNFLKQSEDSVPVIKANTESKVSVNWLRSDASSSIK